jgi:hypothetical protein
MAKNKINITHWSKKKIDRKLYYGSIIFTILLFVLVAFAYSIPAVGIPIESQIQIYFQNLFSNWTNPPNSSPHKNNIPIVEPLGTGMHSYPPVTSILRIAPGLQNPPTLAISRHQPDKLIITRSNDPSFHLTALSITVSNPALVKEIFNDILQLPLFDAPGTIPIKCPEESGDAPVYTLAFYQDNKLTDTAVYRITGCPTITLDNYPARRDYNGWFDRDFQKATGLSGQSLY